MSCTCPSHYHGVLHHVQCALKGPRKMPGSAMYCEHANEVPQSCPCDADCYCRVEGTCRDRAPAMVAPPQAAEPGVGAHLQGVLRVKIEDRPNMPQFGAFLGLLLDEHGDTQAVIRLDHFGLMLKAVHPSRVVPVTAAEEELHK